MTAPVLFNTVKVHGRFVGLDFLPLAGRIVFTATPPAMLDPGELLVIINKPLVVELDGNGEFTAYLPATDDPDIDPVGFTYLVEEKFTGKDVKGRTYSITVPLSAGPSGVDLATASPAVPVIGIVRPQTLDELSDVETLSPLPVGSVLFVDGDGVWRPHLLSTTDITRDEVVASDAWLRNRAADLDALMVGGAITRNSSGAATGAPVIWPDGTPGSYTALVLSVDFPGAVDSYEVTYGSPVAKTVTQPTVTRDASGAITTRPALTVA